MNDLWIKIFIWKSFFGENKLIYFFHVFFLLQNIHVQYFFSLNIVILFWCRRINQSGFFTFLNFVELINMENALKNEEIMHGIYLLIDFLFQFLCFCFSIEFGFFCNQWMIFSENFHISYRSMFFNWILFNWNSSRATFFCYKIQSIFFPV